MMQNPEVVVCIEQDCGKIEHADCIAFLKSLDVLSVPEVGHGLNQDATFTHKLQRNTQDTICPAQLYLRQD